MKKDIKDNALIVRESKKLAENKGEWFYDKASDSDADEIFSSFSKKLSRLARLSEEEELELGIKIQKFNDQSAKQKLVLHNMKLALKMAHQYKREWTNIMDLVQEASYGMAIAAEKWDPHVGTRFGTYAVYWIKAQLTKFLMTNARLIHTANTKAGRKIYFQLPVIQRKLLAEGKKPTIELIAQEVGEDPKEVALVVSRIKGGETALSTPLDDDQSYTLEETIPGTMDDPEKITSHEEMQKLIKKLTESFEKTLSDERDKAIWKEHLISDEPVSLVDLGKRYNVSKQRMGQLTMRIKRKFRCHIVDHLGPNTNLAWLFSED